MMGDMSSDYYGSIAGELADEGRDWPCCGHCDHDPGQPHAGPCITCDSGGPMAEATGMSIATALVRVGYLFDRYAGCDSRVLRVISVADEDAIKVLADAIRTCVHVHLRRGDPGVPEHPLDRLR